MKKYNITVNGTTYEVIVEEAGSVAGAPVYTAPAAYTAPVAPVAPVAPAAPVASAPAAAPKAAPAAPAGPAGANKVTAPMPGTILKVNVQNGASVKKGDVLMILEAMKMENEIVAAADGTVSAVNVSKGTTVETGTVLCTLA